MFVYKTFRRPTTDGRTISSGAGGFGSRLNRPISVLNGRARYETKARGVRRTLRRVGQRRFPVSKTYVVAPCCQIHSRPFNTHTHTHSAALASLCNACTAEEGGKNRYWLIGLARTN